MNILLSTVGRRKYIVEYFKEVLDDEDSIHVSNSDFTIAMEAADSYIITPCIYDPDYISTLLNYCIGNNINGILSLFDLDLLVLAKNRNLFERHNIKLVLAPENSVKICNDKWETFNFLKKFEIRTPKTYLTVGDTLVALKNNEINFPLIVKPRWGTGSLSTYIAENEDELEIFYKKAHREIFNSYLKYESEMTKENPIVIQEYLMGNEYGLDVINDLDANYITTLAKRKIVMRAGETDVGETVNSRPFHAISKMLSNKIKHEGILSVDCIENESEIFVIELNCRISGHYPISHLAGINYIKQLILWLKNEKTDYSLFQITEGIVIIKDLVPQIIEIAN